MSIKRQHIKASALGYAISFLLLISLICSGVLFISSANKRLEMSHTLDEHMLFNNYLSLRYGAVSNKIGTQTIIHPSGDTSIITIKNWGGFKAVSVQTIHNKRVVEKTAITGMTLDEALPSLYIPDKKQAIKLCGNTRIEGNVFTAERGFERGHITGKNYKGDKLIYDGELKKSERNLPPLKNSNFDKLVENVSKIESCEKDSVFSFKNPTTLWSDLNAIQINNNLEGNLIIESFDSIYVPSQITLSHVILKAPIVHFEEGFKGCVQVIAEERIHCEKNVKLKYPSSLSLNEKVSNPDHQSAIIIEEGSQVIGGILMTSEANDFRNPIHLSINHAIVGGLVYNTGETEIVGKIIGSLYTDQLALKYGGGRYGGYLLDATISNPQLPNEFVYPDWLDVDQNNKPTLLACF